MKFAKYLKRLLTLILLLSIAFLLIGVFVPRFSYISEVDVDAPVDQAFAIFSNPSWMSEWMEGFKSIENLSGAPNEVGSRWKLVVEQEGERMELIEEVTAYKANELFAFTLDAEPLTSEVEIRFIPLDSTTTKITAVTSVRGKNILWRSLLPMFKSRMREQSQESYDKLKTVIERNT